jgi:hypothetical protein
MNISLDRKPAHRKTSSYTEQNKERQKDAYYIHVRAGFEPEISVFRVVEARRTLRPCCHFDQDPYII